MRVYDYNRAIHNETEVKKMKKSTLVYSASLLTKSWTNTPVTIESLIAKGSEVTKARLSGDFTLWINGFNAGALFIKKTDQIKFYSNIDQKQTSSARLLFIY